MVDFLDNMVPPFRVPMNKDERIVKMVPESIKPAVAGFIDYLLQNAIRRQGL